MSLEWYTARDHLFGINYESINMPHALQLARQCKDDDAAWLCSLFPTCPKNEKEMRATLDLQERDGRVLCFRYMLKLNGYAEYLKESAELGYPLAQALYGRVKGQERYAALSAISGEREGYVSLYHIEENLDEEAILLKKAAHLGHANSQTQYATRFLQVGNPERYFWLGQVLRKSVGAAISTMLGDVNKNPQNTLILYNVGKYASGASLARFYHSDEKERMRNLHSRYNDANVKTKEAIYCWLLIGKSLSVVRDIRNVIAKLIYKQAHEWI